MPYASLKSIAAYTPKDILSNNDLEKMVATSDEWISKRTGIKTRCIADSKQCASDLGFEAAKKALRRAALSIKDIDLILVASISGDYLFMPSTACVLAAKLGAKNTPAFDLLAACSGFIYGLSVARAYIISGMAKRVLLVGTEVLSRFVDYEQRGTCILFGDGAGAAVLSCTDIMDESIKDVNIFADGNYEEMLLTPIGGSKAPLRQDNLQDKGHYIKMDGVETFKVAVAKMTEVSQSILANTATSIEALDYFIPHQANQRIMDAVAKNLQLNKDQVVSIISRYGNTSAASIPVAINDLYENGKLNYMDQMLLVALGGGLTWGAALLRFAG